MRDAVAIFMLDVGIVSCSYRIGTYLSDVLYSYVIQGIYLPICMLGKYMPTYQ